MQHVTAKTVKVVIVFRTEFNAHGDLDSRTAANGVVRNVVFLNLLDLASFEGPFRVPGLSDKNIADGHLARGKSDTDNMLIDDRNWTTKPDSTRKKEGQRTLIYDKCEALCIGFDEVNVAAEKVTREKIDDLGSVGHIISAVSQLVQSRKYDVISTR